MDAQTYRNEQTKGRSRTGGDDTNRSQRAGRRRREPSPKEQARRVAWGKQWGQIMRDAARELGFGRDR